LTVEFELVRVKLLTNYAVLLTNSVTRLTLHVKLKMPIYVTYFIQLLLIVHVLKTGRDRIWIWVLLLLPLVGGVAYLFMEIMPSFMGGVTGQKAKRGVMQLVDPGGDVRDCARAWEQSANAENGRRYAQALINADKPKEALEILEQSRSGFFENDATLLLLEAQARFLIEDWPATIKAIESQRKENPEHTSAQGHLLYARALDASGHNQEAISEFREVAGYFPGAEARYRLAIALANQDDQANARKEFENIINDASLAPAHFRKSQKEWIKASKEALKEMD